MKTTTKSFLRLATLVAIAAAAAPAGAVLLDHGPSDPTLLFPIWYRDLNSVPLQLCRSQTPSPNALAGLKPMCFPLAADPAGFPGNLGPEIFYNNVNAKLTGPGLTMTYVAGLEASYLPAGQPVHGTEAVFARIRVFLTPPVSGTYTVTHPFGVEVFTDLTAGHINRFTADVGLTIGDFNAALAGRVGPWIQWDVVNLGESLTNSAGEQFVGDPNFAHTFTGSPFGTNYIRIDGPAGSNLDGAGNSFIVTTLANVMGQKYLAAIPTPLTIQRATYSRDPVKNLNTVDVWASSAPGQKLVLTGTDMPSLIMKDDGTGSYYSHLEYPATAFPPASVTVTNMLSNPVNSATAGLTDLVNVTSATYDTLTGKLTVSATSSDLSAPLLSVLGPSGGLMTAGSFSTILPATAHPPMKVSVGSSAGGADTDDVVILPGLPMNPAFPPVAVPDTFTVAGAGPTTFDVTANDSVTPPAGIGSVLIVGFPTLGTATAAASGGLVTYTPSPGASGTDTLVYVLQDSLGNVSNAATVTLTVPFVAPPPTANADSFAMLQNTSRTYAVLANDVAGVGTTINPASVTIASAPAHGTALVNLDGTITYTPAPNFNSALDTFSYTVANNAGVASAPATVTVEVFGGPESVSFSKINYTVSKARWTIVGSTNWFNAALTQTTVTCWLNVTGNPVIGTAPVDIFGKFQLVPLFGPTPPNPSSVTCQTSNGGIKAGGVVFN